MAESKSAHDYMLRVAADEIDYLERDIFLRQLPHVMRFVGHPVGRFLLTHLQNFCWTTERLLRNRRKTRTMREAFGVAHKATVEPGRTKVGRAPPAFWLDITNTTRVGSHGGIGRAALNLAKAGVDTGLAIPVFIEDGDVYEYVGPHARGPKLAFTQGITYMIADSFWQQADEYSAVCQKARAAGAKVAVCLHDVILLYYPNFNRSEFVRAFSDAFGKIIPLCDVCIASSVYTREKVRYFVEKMQLCRGRPLALTQFSLGADGHVCVDPQEASEQIQSIFKRPNVFVSVGTLEPRKGYAISLDAFDRLWADGVDCSFLIIGRPGWLALALQGRITAHPEYGKRLHWLNGGTDADVTYAYRNARCVLQTSITEGFGLPIVEASLEGTPVIATDNEIFREIGGDEIHYFRMCDSADLAEKIASAVAERPRAGHLRALKWDESLALMVARVGEALERRDAA